MLNKSLTARRCLHAVLCGISSRFQLLSPKQRQVAHALLTRPPLIRDRSPFTVRLECVRHAASVHPEPGSNSRAFGILSLFRGLKSFLEFCFLALLFYFLKELYEIVFTFVQVFLDSVLCTFSFAVQFSRTAPPVLPFGLSLRQGFYSTTFLPVCQYLFSIFFFFSGSVFFLPPRRLDYYTTPSGVCQVLFLSFLKFFSESKFSK